MGDETSPGWRSCSCGAVQVNVTAPAIAGASAVICHGCGDNFALDRAERDELVSALEEMIPLACLGEWDNAVYQRNSDAVDRARSLLTRIKKGEGP